jgi:UDP-N-acetylglucosamine 2-epimerase (non-hydrolysing)
MAAAIDCAKLGIPLAHVEAGLRSFDNTMPEEINRRLTDAVADFLFVSEESGVLNLRAEGVGEDKIFLVGNVMIDSLLRCRKAAAHSDILRQLNVAAEGEAAPYAVLTLHRPSNVDDPAVMLRVLEPLAELAREVPVFFPVHPRTQERMRSFGFARFLATAQNGKPSGIIPLEPLGYLDFLCLMDHAALVLTDSGGIQEETTALGVPCITLRENTERPATVECGTNRVVGLDPDRILSSARQALSGEFPKGRRPQLWDGRAAERIVRIALERLRPELVESAASRQGA